MAGETIDRAAIRRYSTVWSVPRPGRHHDVIAFMAEQGVDALGDYSTQGFTTSEGRFVERDEAIDRHPLPVKGLSLCGFQRRRQNGARGGSSFRAPEPRA